MLGVSKYRSSNSLPIELFRVRGLCSSISRSNAFGSAEIRVYDEPGALSVNVDHVDVHMVEGECRELEKG